MSNSRKQKYYLCVFEMVTRIIYISSPYFYFKDFWIDYNITVFNILHFVELEMVIVWFAIVTNHTTWLRGRTEKRKYHDNNHWNLSKWPSDLACSSRTQWSSKLCFEATIKSDQDVRKFQEHRIGNPFGDRGELVLLRSEGDRMMSWQTDSVRWTN